MNADPPLIAFEDDDALLASLDRREADRREAVDDRRLGIEELVHDCLKQVHLLRHQVEGLPPELAAPLRSTVSELGAVLRHAVAPPEVGQVDVRAVLRAVIGRAALVHAARLELDAPQTATVTADAVMLHRALTNLVVNACQASDGGVVRVGLSVGDDEAQIEVEDDGGQGLHERPPGVGLGLWIVHDVVDHAGGRVERGVSPLGGWCVRMRLPLTPAAPR